MLVEWLYRSTNKKLRELRGFQPIDDYGRLLRWKWTHHFSRSEEMIIKPAPGWCAQARGRGRPKGARMRSV